MEILPQLLVNALITGSIYALASAGIALTYGLLRILNFAHGHLMMVGAYMFYLFSIDLGFGLLASALFTLLSVVAVSLFCLAVFVTPFTRFSPLLSLVTTVALSTILESVVAMVFGVNVKSLATSFDITSYEIAGVYITPIQILIIASALAMMAILGPLIHLTPFGRQIRALTEHGPSAQALGIPSQRVVRIVFTLSVILAAYAGILVGYETNLQPTMGNLYTMKAFAAMILGGLGNVWGTMVGCFLLGLVENLSIGLDFGSWSIPAGYKDAFAFLIILLVLLVRPQGLFNTASRAA